MITTTGFREALQHKSRNNYAIVFLLAISICTGVSNSVSSQNPLVMDQFTADPFASLFNNRGMFIHFTTSPVKRARVVPAGCTSGRNHFWSLVPDENPLQVFDAYFRWRRSPEVSVG